MGRGDGPMTEQPGIVRGRGAAVDDYRRLFRLSGGVAVINLAVWRDEREKAVGREMWNNGREIDAA